MEGACANNLRKGVCAVDTGGLFDVGFFLLGGGGWMDMDRQLLRNMQAVQDACICKGGTGELEWEGNRDQMV